MAYSTQAYIMQQITRVVSIQTDDGEYFTYRYETVYAKRLTVNKGSDSVLLFEFINQEERPVNLSGSQLTFRIINNDGDELIIQKPMVILNAPYGRAKVTLNARDMLEVDAQIASYSIERTSGVLSEAVFTSSQCGARAPIEIADGVQPSYVPSTVLTIPTTQLSNQSTVSGISYSQFPGWNNPYYGGASQYSQGYISGANTEFFSSFIEPTAAVTTIQMDLVGYTGTIKAQGAENYQSLWYNVTDSKTYYNYTGTIHWNVVGWFPLLRLCFNNSLFATVKPTAQPAVAQALCNNGVVTDIQILNPGMGYQAPPLVNIFGDGAGARAVATIDANGSVAGITVLDGGSGYWPIPVTAANPAANPVPPQNSGAFVVLSTGYVTNLLYR